MEDEKMWSFLDKQLSVLVGAGALAAYLLFCVFWFLWNKLTGHSVRWASILPHRDLIITTATLFVVSMGWVRHKNNSLTGSQVLNEGATADGAAKPESFFDKQLPSIIATSALTAYLVYCIVGLSLKRATGQALPWKPDLTAQNVILTIVSLLLVGLAWSREIRKALWASDQQRESVQRSTAIGLLESGWIDRVFKPSILGEQPMKIPLRIVTEGVAPLNFDGPGRGSFDAKAATQSNASIIDLFADSHQSLLILGSPGSGKTTLLLELADCLRQRAANDPTEALPVVLSAATYSRWRGLTANHRSFENWVFKQIRKHYWVDEDISRRLLTQGKLVLLLDGIDEIFDAETRAAFQRSINAANHQWRLKLAISCRAEASKQLDPFALNMAVQALSPSKSEILAYIGTIPDAERLADSLTSPAADSIIVDTLSSPFTIWLAAETYTGDSKLSLPEVDRFTTHRLLSDFVAHRLQKHPSDEASDILRWLRNLACCSRVGSLNQFQLQDLGEMWFPDRMKRLLARFFIVLAVTAVCAIIEAIIWTPYRGWTLGCSGTGVTCREILFLHGFSSLHWSTTLRVIAEQGLVQAAIAACVIGIPLGVVELVFKPSPIELLPRDRFAYRFRIALRSGCISFSVASILLLLSAYLCRAAQPVDIIINEASSATLMQYGRGIVFTIGFCLSTPHCFSLAGCIGVLVFYFTFCASRMAAHEWEFARSMRTSLYTSCFLGLFGGVALALIPLSRYEQILGLKGQLTFLDIPVGAGLVLMYVAGGLFLIRHYTIRSIMTLTGCGPWNYGAFLKEATRCDFLRRVGETEFMFPHPLLRDYFAEGKFK